MANFCSACGIAVSPDARFCTGCGNRLEGVPEQPRQTAASEPEQPAVPEPEPAPEPPVEPPAPEPELPAQPPKPSAPEHEQPAADPAPQPPVEPPAPGEPDTPAEQPPKPPAERNEGSGAMRVLKGCGIAAAVVFGLFIVLIILAAVFGEPRDEKDTETPSPAPVQETSTEQKEQPAPTAKPEPTTTPIPLCKREAESQYLVALLEFMDVIGTSSTNAGERFLEMGQNPALLLNTEWREGLTLSMGLMLYAATSISELEAPNSLDEVDKVAKRMASQLEDALYLTAAAIDDIDPDKLAQANQIFLELPQLTLEIGDTTSRVCEQ